MNARPVLLNGVLTVILAGGCADDSQTPAEATAAGEGSTGQETTTTGDGDTGQETGQETTTAEGDGDGDGDSGDGDGDGDVDEPTCVSALDILFVVDNSGSMGSAQARLASGISALIEPLDAAGVDWRIAVTTTDNGNPECQVSMTTPESGNFVLSSCKQRINDFLSDNGAVDVQDLACNAVCSLDSVQILPTTTEFEPNPAPRKWVEKIAGVSNLGGGVDPAEALACLLPMGINGCEFESPLESAYLGLARADAADEDEYGFLRLGASVLVVIVSDEVDCSYNKDYSEIFEADGNKVFWSDPGSPSPTSAVCWNAGVECSGDPSNYDTCDPVNKGVDGSVGVADAEAVLHPLSRYYGRLDGIEALLEQFDPEASVRVSLIGGVALDGTITYAISPDPQFQGSFGIGANCASGDLVGLPPVRMREVMAHTGGIARSVCADEYASALTDMIEPFIATCPNQ